MSFLCIHFDTLADCFGKILGKWLIRSRATSSVLQHTAHIEMTLNRA